MTLFDSFLKRFLWASLIWLVSWPVLYFIKLGVITGPKAWFWIIGELNYPVIAIFYYLLDSVLSGARLKPWIVFIVAVGVIAALMPYYYNRVGFALGVSIEARLF